MSGTSTLRSGGEVKSGGLAGKSLHEEERAKFKWAEEPSMKKLVMMQSNAEYTTEKLAEIFRKRADDPKKGLNRQEFGQALKDLYSIDPVQYSLLLDRLFELFDTDGNGVVDFQEFASALSLLSRGTLDEHLHYLFDVFDLNGDGKLTKDEIDCIVSSLWDNKVCQQLFDFALDEKRIEGPYVFVNKFFSKADLNDDGYIDFDEFRRIAKKYTHEYLDHKLKILPTQTGGHPGAFSMVEEGKIAKAATSTELQFYLNLPTRHPIFIPYLPRYYGIQGNCVIMEDLTYGMDFPCVMDLKMGTTTISPESDDRKQRRSRLKDLETTTHSLGCRLTGMRVWNIAKQEYETQNKSIGRKLDDLKLRRMIQKYFENGISMRGDLIKLFLVELDKILKFFEDEQKMYHFIACSLLFVYEGNEEKDPHIKLKLIDFAHVYPLNAGEREEGFIYGLKNVIKMLQVILELGHQPLSASSRTEK